MGDLLARLSAPFPKESISWRAQSVTQDGTKAMALAYIDARDVMKRLDEVVGPENWQRRYSHAEIKTICEIGIFLGYSLMVESGKPETAKLVRPGEWVWKADGAGDTDIEAEKGAISDAFKRAAVNWGIGRYLYDMPAPWVPCESYDSNGKKKWKRFTEDPWKYVKASEPNPPTDGAKTAREEYGTADKLKKAFVEIQEAIKTAGDPEDFVMLQERIDKCRLVDSQCADQLQKQLDDRESYIMAVR